MSEMKNAAEQQAQGKGIGQLVREWLQFEHADKLRVVDPATGKWVSMTVDEICNNEFLPGVSGRTLGRLCLMRGDAEDDFEEGVYRIVGLKGEANNPVLQREGTDDYFTLQRDVFAHRLIKTMD